MKRARIHDGVGKLRALQVVTKLRARLDEIDAKPADFADARQAGFNRAAGWTFLRMRGRLVGLEAAFTNGNPLNSGTVVLPSGDRLYWQYQAGQWRLAVQTSHYSGKDLRQKRHHYIAQHYLADWFNFDLLAETLGVSAAKIAPPPERELFHRYDPDFAYRYCKVDGDERALTLAEIVHLGTAYLVRALDRDQVP